MKHLLLSLVLGLFASGSALADRITVAVAANFLVTAQEIVRKFEAETGHEVALVHGSTGKLYAQIIAGAPFDVFLSADTERPARLLADGWATGAARDYAYGRLALVIRDETPTTLASAFARRDLRLAIADPAVAPYGAAAQEVLQRHRQDDGAENVIFGESVGQTFAYFATGNVDMALVALSQVRQSKAALNVIDVPEDQHTPLRQDAVLLRRAVDNPAARAFLDYLARDTTRQMIRDAGYGIRQ